jgi:hypothetical protein
VTVTVALADCVEAEALCAVTLRGPFGTLDCPVYKPLEEIVPTDEFPLETPATSQFTAVLVVPETVAVNCCDTPTCTLALPGQIVTERLPVLALLAKRYSVLLLISTSLLTK